VPALAGLVLVVQAPLAQAATPSVVAAATGKSDPVVVAAGDIACDPANSNFAGTDPSTCQQAATAKEVVSLHPQYLLPIGDEQYLDSTTEGQQPTLTQYQQGYGASWGKIQTAAEVPGIVVHPVPGNHDYGDVVECDTCGAFSWTATTYFKYFGSGSGGLGDLPASVTGPSNDWYGFDVPVNGGTWHVIALDTICAGIGGCGVGSPEETWFRHDLQLHQGQCILVEQHNPAWASGAAGNDSTLDALWADAVQYHAAAVLAGHDHYYERFNPMDAKGNPSSTGTAEIIVGTGGADHNAFGTQAAPFPAVQQNTQFGVLDMVLHSSGLSYQFLSTSGATLDSGSLPCSNPPPVGVPSVSGLAPGSGPSAGGTSVTVTGTNFTGATAVSFGAVPAASFKVNSVSSITAVAPAGSGTVDTTVTSPAGTSATGVADQFSYVVSTNGYAVSLSGSSATPAVGASVTLTATANQDVGPTPYGIWVYDTTTGALVAHAPSGTSVSAAVSQSAASTQRYVAYVANSGPTNIQATSTPLTVTWR
jgi:hypothetical protein